MDSLFRATVGRRRRERLVIKTFTSTTRRDGIPSLLFELSFEIFDQTFDEARLTVLVDAVSQVFSEDFNLARLFLDYLVRGLALDDARRQPLWLNSEYFWCTHVTVIELKSLCLCSGLHAAVRRLAPST